MSDKYPELAVRVIGRYLDDCALLTGEPAGLNERLAIMFALSFRLSEGIRGDASNAGVQQIKDLVEKSFEAGWKAGAESRPKS